MYRNLQFLSPRPHWERVGSFFSPPRLSFLSLCGFTPMSNCNGPRSKPRHQRGLGDHTDLSGAQLRRHSAASLRGWVFPRLFSSAYFPTIPPMGPLAPREHRHKIDPDASARLCVRSPGARSRGHRWLPAGASTRPASCVTVMVLELVLIGSLAYKTAED